MLCCRSSIQCRSVDPFSSSAASIIFRHHHPSHVTPEALLSYQRIKIRAKNGSCSDCHSHVKIRKLKVNVNCQGTVANSLPLTTECLREWVGGPIVLITFCTMNGRSKACSCSILFCGNGIHWILTLSLTKCNWNYIFEEHLFYYLFQFLINCFLFWTIIGIHW